MRGAGRTAGIGVRTVSLERERACLVADDQISGQQENLLPIVMDKGKGGASARCEPQQSRPVADSTLLVERAGKNFLLDPVRIASRRAPSGREIELVEFAMLLR